MSPILWLRQSEKGAVAIIVAVVLVMLVTVGGAAIELAKLLYVRQSLQQSLDGAAVAAAAIALNEATGSTPDRQRMINTANLYFQNNNKLSPSLVTAAISTVYSDDTSATNEDSIISTVSASMPLNFALFLGRRTIDFTLTATAKRPRPAPVELVLAVDVTSSMADPFGSSTKMAALKTSAKSLISVLMKSDASRVGLVPFSAYINIGTDQGYTDTALQESKVPWLTFGPKPTIYDCTKYSTDPADCTTTTGTCYNDGRPYTCQIRTCKCLDWKLRAVSFTGCVFLRTGSSLTTIAAPTAPAYVGFWTICTGIPITNLVSKNQTFRSGTKTVSAESWLAAKIDALSVNINPNIGTYFPVPLVWAWNMLTTETTDGGAISTDFPLQAGYTAADVQKLKVRKALVLITDGTNSMFASGGGNLALIEKSTQKAANQAAADRDTRNTCNNIKAAGIKIYVIALKADVDLTFEQLMKDCAGAQGETWERGYYFDASNPAELTSAFERIGRSFNMLTITN
jgi:Flp pilus assembly protein TadG